MSQHKPHQKCLAVLLIFLFTVFAQNSLMAQTYNKAMPTGLPNGLEKSLTSTLRTGQGTRSGGAEGTTQKIGGNGGGGMEGVGGGMEYQVHVLGRVTSPGTYRVSPSVRVAEAIGLAGGVDPRGSLRSIELRRAGVTKEKIDMSLFFEKGDLNANPFLQDNDVIFVPTRSKNVRIEGPVKKSGVYELAGETNVWDIIQLAGGFTVGVAEEAEVVIVRYEHDKKQIIRVSNVAEELKRTPIQNGDIIVVPHIFTKDKKFDYAFPNLPEDGVFYPSYNDQVYVAGAVLKPGPYEYQGHLTMLDYINMAGPDPRGRLKSARVLRPDGTRVRNVRKYSLSPGDTIIVPEKKVTFGNSLAIYNTFTSTLFTFVSLRSLIRDGVFK